MQKLRVHDRVMQRREADVSGQFETEELSKTLAPPPFAISTSTSMGTESEDSGMESELDRSVLDQGGFTALPPNDNNSDAPVQRVGAQGGSQSSSADRSESGGLPGQLRGGLEQLSGEDLSDVQVHYNSSKPAELEAHAYAQGNQIHLGPGQEEHLPHEGWHVVQQKQGRVKASGEVGGEPLNDDAHLEQEADEMGASAMAMDLSEESLQAMVDEENQMREEQGPVQAKFKAGQGDGPVQAKFKAGQGDGPVQRMADGVVQRQETGVAQRQEEGIVQRQETGVVQRHSEGIVQRQLIAKGDGLRQQLQGNAQLMLDIIGNWPDDQQTAILLKDAEQETQPNVQNLDNILAKLYGIHIKVQEKPNFKTLYEMTLRDSVQEGKTENGLYNVIKRPFSGIFKGNIEGNYDWILNGKDMGGQIGQKSSEELLSDYLARAGKAEMTKAEKYLRENVGGRYGLADKMQEDIQDFQDIDKLEYIKRNKKELEEALKLIPAENRTPHQQRMFEIQKAHLEQLENWEPWQTEYQKTARKIEIMNAERLTMMQDNSKRVSPKVKTFMDNYRIDEVNKEYKKNITEAGIAEKKTSDFGAQDDQKDTTGYVVNLISGIGRAKPKVVADQYYNQAFDAATFGGEENRAAQAPYRMSMVMGINFFETIDNQEKTNTKDVKKYVETEGVTDKFPMVSFGFVWQPNWLDKKGKAVKMSTLRAAFNDMDGSEKEQIRAYERQSVTKIQEHIPYGSLRDTVTTSKHTQGHVQFLSRHNKQAYIYSGDDDAPSLKLDAGDGEKGVFTRTDDVMTDIAKHPMMLIGGYRFGLGKGDKLKLDPENPGEYLTYLADVLNQAIRGFLENGLSVYPTEPSLFVKAYEQKDNADDFKLFGNDNLFEGDEGSRTLKEDKTLWGDGAGEGRALRNNLMSANSDEQDVVFDQRAGVLTDPGRFKLSNEVQVPSKHNSHKDIAQEETFLEMRKRHSGDNPKRFLAQVLADFVLQNQSMADRRTLAREMNDSIRLESLDQENFSLLLEEPESDKSGAELTAMMIHNNQLTKKIYELSKIGDQNGATYDQYLEHLRFSWEKGEDYDDLNQVNPTVTPSEQVGGKPTVAYGKTKGNAEVATGKKLKPEYAAKADKMVKKIMAKLEGLQVGGKSFWVELKETMDKIVQQNQSD